MAKLLKDVIVLSNSELGWDCIVGVFNSEEEAVKQLNEDEGEVHTQDYYEQRCYCFFKHKIEL